MSLWNRSGTPAASVCTSCASARSRVRRTRHPSRQHAAARCWSPGRAYTLIELLIVVAVLGVSSALLIPKLVDRNALRVQAAVRQLIGDLSFAQSDALSHQEMRRVHFYPDGTGYCLVALWNSTELSQAFNEATAHFINDPLNRPGAIGRYIMRFDQDDRYEGVSIESAAIDGTGRDLNFDTMGGTVTTGNAPGLGGTIVMKCGPERYEIRIAPFTGKLTVRQL